MIEPTYPSVPPDYAHELISKQLEIGREMLEKRRIDEGDLLAWKNTTGQYLLQAFGSQNANVYNFGSAGGSITKYFGATEEHLDAQRSEGLERQLKHLESVLDQLEAQIELRNRSTESSDDRETSLSIIENLLSRFHIVVRQLLERHDGRPTLDVADEYDVQDLLHSLLRLFFEDIRPEEWTPSYAGGAARMDFLIKEEEIVIETKMAGKSLSARALGNQLIEDIARYREHPNCRILLAFVYDPFGRIDNPRGIENDLSRIDSGLEVRVMIVPRGT